MNPMKKRDLIDLAKKYFIFDAGLSKANLIRKIQVEQGQGDCYATGRINCEQMACPWRNDCFADFAEDAAADNSAARSGSIAPPGRSR